MAWCKLEDTYSDHPKFARLARLLGVSRVTARGHVSTLWAWCLRHAPDGCLASYDRVDTALAAEWDGDADLFIEAMIKCRLIDETGDGLELHGWMERAESNRRAQQRRKDRQRAKAEARQSSPRVDTVLRQSGPRGEERRGEERRGEERRDQIYVEQSLPRVDTVEAQKTAQAPAAGSPPSVPLGDRSPPAAKWSGEIQQVWTKYREHHPRCPEVLRSKAKEYRLIRARLEEGWSLDDLCRAIDGYHVSPWHTGENPGGKRYLGLELMMRDTDHVRAGLDHLEQRGAPVLSEKTQRTMRAAKSFAERIMANAGK